MPLALGVRQVIPFVFMKCKAKFALIRSQVVFHYVRVLRQVDGLEREAAQPLLALQGGLRLGQKATGTDLRTFAMLKVDSAIHTK